MKMSATQKDSHFWLSRAWYMSEEIENLEKRREEIICSMSGIGKYDSEHIPTQNGENATETKNLEYSEICRQIEKKQNDISKANYDTLKVIEHLDSAMFRGMLIAKYIRRLSWSAVGKIYNYEKTQMYEKYRLEALDAVYPYIPKEEIIRGREEELD